MVIGEAASMRSITKYGALYALNKAMDAIDARLVEEANVVSLPSHAVLSRPRSSAHTHLERRAYETVLDRSAPG